MKRILLLLAIAANSCSYAQTSKVIPQAEVQRIENMLASDDMRGRRAGTPDIDRAAGLIATEFKKAGLQPLQGNSFLQTFSLMRPRLVSVTASINGAEADPKTVIAVTCQPELKVDEHSGYEAVFISSAENLPQKVQSLIRANRNIIAFVDTSFLKTFPRIANFKRQLFKTSTSVIFVASPSIPSSFQITVVHIVDEMRLTNIVGQLPGRSRKNEFVVFSGHYDHLGVKQQTEQGDSIYNGANDDAAGTTAVILLADYFHRRHDNERTLIFAAFTAEEIGGFGSQYFSRQLDPKQVMAMFNIEMIGTESKWGADAAYITGFEKTDMGAILQKNLDGSSFHFYPDPYTTENLFYRSDNATLARLGVPAHTISTAKMENEPNYHKVSDEVSTLDLSNMSRIIEAIATSSSTIISGKDTPSRVQTEGLR
jgi:hypothetical protein